ncbi:MAG TPA: arginine--tRNA ligase [Rhodospirillales bacterium]|jgi:arginyl-tRNA synthetase|nr:MAG: Arginine--tRNA ligase [Alphaproteobacteria bacterium MarineAlpha3_Bin2]HIC30153.1 arginine--tRNA ligase [Rhodospirillales bacterium]
MNIYQHFRDEILSIVDELASQNVIPAGMDTGRITVEPPREAGHGDMATNAAMVLSKAAGMKPRDLAAVLSERLNTIQWVHETEIAGPGFINLRLESPYWHQRLEEILQNGTAFGDSTLGRGETVNVEYVSANPTGPLHVAHARGAVVGDVLASLLEKAGYAVTREYYVNDAGAQVDILARSAYLRYREALGEKIKEIPKGLYPGEYLIPVGEALAEKYGDQWLGADEEAWLADIRSFAAILMMDEVREDLKSLGIDFDVFSSEKTLVEKGAVEGVLEQLEKMDLIYTGVLEPPKGKIPDDWEPRPQTLFRASQFGDEVDRALKKSDGTWTYFATDMAYHLDKFQRGFKSMINVWGADHGGYVKRMKAAVGAVTGGEGELDVKICQMVHLKKGGEALRMSKRAGTFVTLSDLIGEVGRDVVRFMMLTRKNDSQMEFDLDKALEQSRDNPVFYVHYAHARCRSVLRNAATEWGDDTISPSALAAADLSLLTDPSELDLIKVMAAWPRMVENAAEAHEPHRIAYYLNELATLFHALWNKGNDDARLRFIITGEPALTIARLALVQGVATVIVSGLQVIGVSPVEEL